MTCKIPVLSGVSVISISEFPAKVNYVQWNKNVNK